MSPPMFGKALKRNLIQICVESLNLFEFLLSRATLALLIFFCGFWIGAPLLAETITGNAVVIDGRTLEVSGHKVRLWGIDSPDPEQTCKWGAKTIPCGRLAQGALMDLIIGAAIRCEPRKEAESSLNTAVCFADSYDIGANLIHTGWALAQDPTSPVYRETERKARAAKRGLWRGEFTRPADWRTK